MNQQQQPNVAAVPNLYIDVVINGQKQIYDVPTARQLRDQLDQALLMLDAPPAAPETDPVNPPDEPENPDVPEVGEALTDPAEDAHRAA